MHSLVHSEIFDLALVVGTYIAATILYKKTHLSVLHPLLTSIFVIIVILEFLDIEYASFQQGSHLIHFMLGPSVVALGYVLFEQMKYLKGNVVSILTSVFVGAIVGIISVIVIGKLMGADQSLIATLQPKSVTTPIAMGVSEAMGGRPDLTACLVVITGIFGSIVGRPLFNLCRITSDPVRGVTLGLAAHGMGTSAAFQISNRAGAFGGLAMGLSGIITAFLAPLIAGPLMKLLGI